MKLGTLRKAGKEDLQKAASEALPKWIDALLGPVNEFIEKVGQALQNRLTFEDNFYAKLVNQSFDSGVELEVNAKAEFSGNARAYGVLLLGSSGTTVSTFAWAQKTNGNIAVTVTFVSATSAKCDLLLLLR
jgi:hypothetical protein